MKVLYEEDYGFAVRVLNYQVHVLKGLEYMFFLVWVTTIINFPVQVTTKYRENHLWVNNL